MRYTSALQHFGTDKAMATAAACTKQAVGQWRKADRVPKRSALMLEKASKGKVKVDATLYAKTAPSSARRARV